MRWLIAALALVVVGLGAWLLSGVRGPDRQVAEPARETATPTVAAPPERATRDVDPNASASANANANVNANVDAAVPTVRAVPPPPERVQAQTPEYYRTRLDRERRELEHFRAIVDSPNPRDPGEVKSAQARLLELERQIHADEIRLEKSGESH